MAFIIAEPCSDVKDTACLNSCPADCIHSGKDQSEFESARMLYIDPVETIYAEDNLPYRWDHYARINAEHYEK